MPFQIGNKLSVGNRGGSIAAERRYMNKAFSRACQKILNEPDLTDKKLRTGADRLARRYYQQALKTADPKIGRFLVERAEGAAPQQINLQLDANIRQISLNMDIGQASEAYSDLLTAIGESGLAELELSPGEFQSIEALPEPKRPSTKESENHRLRPNSNTAIIDSGHTPPQSTSTKNTEKPQLIGVRRKVKD